MRMRALAAIALCLVVGLDHARASTPTTGGSGGGSGGGGTPADAISPAATDGTGAVGAGTDYAREDHRHPSQTSSNTASSATGDVAATNVQAAIAELASEKLATSANVDDDDDLSNNALCDIGDVDCSTPPVNGQIPRWNGTGWAPDDETTLSTGEALVFQLGIGDGANGLSYAATITQFVAGTTNDPWTAAPGNDSTCFNVDIAGAGRGRVTYTCAPDIKLSCHWKMQAIAAAAGATDGEGMDVGLAVNDVMVPLSRAYMEFDTDVTTNIGYQIVESLEGEALLEISQNDQINLASLGYASAAGAFSPWHLEWGCEEAGSSGQNGADGADGIATIPLYIEPVSDGDLPNYWFTTQAFTAGHAFCVTDQGSVNVQVTLTGGTLFASPVLCDTTPRDYTTFGGTNGASISANDYADIGLSSTTGSPSQVTFTVTP